MTQTQKVWNTYEVAVPLNGVQATLEGSLLTLKGDKGEVSRVFKFPYVNLEVKDGNVSIITKRFTQRQKKIMHTYRAHITNMVKGVTEGFKYTLKVVYAKFPMTVELKGTTFTVKNFLGEKVPRSVTIPQGVKVQVKGQDITVEGIDKEACGQVAALLEQTTKISHLDRRVIQDGVFITEKPHVKYV